MKPVLRLAPLALLAGPGLAATAPTKPAPPPTAAQAVPHKPAPGQPIPGKPIPGKPIPGKPIPGQPIPGQPIPGKAGSARPAPVATGVPAAIAGPPIAVAELRLGDGTPAGIARIRPKGDHIVLEIALSGIPAGVHGIHLHAVGKCDGPGFTTAGPHLNPLGHQHGIENPLGSHLGDLPNLTADANGRVGARFGLNLEPEVLSRALFDADGTAIVLHAGEDDYRSDPAGNSGARIACGVLVAPAPVAGPEIGR